MLDPVLNFGKTEVSTGYNAAATSVALSSGHGARLPNPDDDGPYNVVWWNITDYPDPSDDPNVEIVRVTDRISDTLEVTRAQEGTLASTKNTAGKTYAIILALTKKTIDEIDTAITNAANDIIELNDDEEVPTGAVDDSNMAFVFTRRPKRIVVNGASYRYGSTIGGTAVWTWDNPTLTATLSFAPGTGGDIYGIMPLSV